MREDPTWRVPASIQREEEEAGKDVEDEVEPGPDNPLGKYWIGLSFPIIGIHGTNHPVSVYSYRTHGCVRLHPDDIEALFNDVDLNDRGVIAYYPVMLARLRRRPDFPRERSRHLPQRHWRNRRGEGPCAG